LPEVAKKRGWRYAFLLGKLPSDFSGVGKRRGGVVKGVEEPVGHASKLRGVSKNRKKISSRKVEKKAAVDDKVIPEVKGEWVGNRG